MQRPCRSQTDVDAESWLRDRLAAERARLEELHAALLADFSEKQWWQPTAPSAAVPTFPPVPGCVEPQPLEGWFPPGSRYPSVATTASEATTEVIKGAEQQTTAEFDADLRLKSEARLVSLASCTPIVPTTNQLNELKMRTSRISAKPMPPSTLYGKFEAVVEGTVFEIFFASAIMLNAICMALELQYIGLDAGFSCGYRTYVSSADDAWPGASNAFRAIERMFAVLFTVELIMRIAGYRHRWLLSCWSYLDAIIVALALTTWINGQSGKMLINPTIVRLARFGKLMRIVKMFRNAVFLDSLKLIMDSISASFTTLCWSLVVMLVIMSLAGMVLCQLLQPFILDDTDSDPAKLAIRQEVFNYYGSFWRAIVTMFEITFANWAPACRLLLNEVDEWYGMFFLVYRCVIGFSVLSVIQAVFIQQTMKTAQLDEDYITTQKMREKDRYAKRLKKIFDACDESGDGIIDKAEFDRAIEDEEVRLAMSTMEVEPGDAQHLFKMLSGDDEKISTDEFVGGLRRLKGSAKAMDLVSLQHMVRRLELKIDGRFDALAGLRSLGQSRGQNRSLARSLQK